MQLVVAYARLLSAQMHKAEGRGRVRRDLRREGGGEGERKRSSSMNKLKLI